MFSGPTAVPPDLGEVDVVLPLLHGTFGEDGTIQGLLEMAGIRYAGAGVLASAAGMDKEYMKLLFAARGLPIGPYVVVRDRDWGPSAPTPSASGCSTRSPSSAGRCSSSPPGAGRRSGRRGWPDPTELEAAIEEARRYDRKVLVEAAIDGVEVECAVLEGVDGGPPEARVPGQIVVDPDSTWYDFEAKYLAAETRMEIPAPIPGRGRRAGAGAVVRGVRRDLLRGARPGRLLLHARRRRPRQRDQHDAGDDADVRVPDDVGGHRAAAAALIDRIITTALAKPAGRGSR